MRAPRVHLDALIESFLEVCARFELYSDEWLACRKEIDRLRALQRDNGHFDYFTRNPEAA